MHDEILMRILYGLADQAEQADPFYGQEILVVAIFGDRHAIDVFHDEVRQSVIRGAAVE